MIVAIGAFSISLGGIIVLFALKYQEQKSGRVLLPELRVRADAWALSCKTVLLSSRGEIEKFPPLMLAVARSLLHELALALAALARLGEEQAHRLADMVSHKHRFERRPPRTGAPRSEFLRQVSEHKGGGGDGTGNAPVEHDESAR